MMLSVPSFYMPRSGLGYLGEDSTDYGNTEVDGGNTTVVDTSPYFIGGDVLGSGTNASDPWAGTLGSGAGGALIPGDPGYAAALSSQCSATGGAVSPGGAGCSYSSDVTCAAAGGTWSGSSCSTPNVSFAPQAGGLPGFLTALTNNTPLILKAISGQPVTSAQCAQVGGTWNAATNSCTPGLSSYMPLLLAAGTGLVLITVLGNKGRH
jgi:hypothetical protein